MNKKDVYLWFVSAALFIIPLILLGTLVYNNTLFYAIIILLVFAAVVSFYTYCTKKITLPEGYTVVQAMFFYMDCKKKGLASSSSIHRKFDDIRQLAKTHEFAKNLNDEEITQLYISGKKFYKEIKNV